MKVPGLLKKLEELTKDEVSKFAVEFYKWIPKSKKEDYNVDELINNPEKKETRCNLFLNI